MGSRGVLESDRHLRAVRRVLLITLGLNVIVASAKIAVGHMTGSVGILSDGFHSLFDGASNIVGLVGIWMASNPPDEDHPYGHKKYETLFSVFIALMILGTGFEILKRVVSSFMDGGKAVAATEGFVVMALTMAVNIFVSTYEGRKGREFRSGILIADSLHTRSDILASVAVIIGLVFTRMGFAGADIIAGLVVTGFIARTGVGLLRSSSQVLTDATGIRADEVREAALAVPGVRGCHAIRTRGIEESVYVDIHITVDPRMPVTEAHDITTEVEAALRGRFPHIADVMVHAEPDVDLGKDHP